MTLKLTIERSRILAIGNELPEVHRDEAQWMPSCNDLAAFNWPSIALQGTPPWQPGHFNTSAISSSVFQRH
jgi:hypothetical protein